LRQYPNFYHDKSIVFLFVISCLSGDATKKEIEDILAETLKMEYLSHPNVINLIGVSISSTLSPILIMPFMENGSLLEYVKK